MIVVLNETHKKHLLFLTSLSIEILQEFCKISIEFIRNGSNPKVFPPAAKKLGVELEDLQNGVSALCHLFSESSKLAVDEIDFHDSLILLNLPEEVNELIKSVYLEFKPEIRNILDTMSFDLPHYTNLDWRLDIQLSCRSISRLVEPVLILKLDTNVNDKPESKILQTDASNLKHICSSLDSALTEVRTANNMSITSESVVGAFFGVAAIGALVDPRSAIFFLHDRSLSVMERNEVRGLYCGVPLGWAIMLLTTPRKSSVDVKQVVSASLLGMSASRLISAVVDRELPKWGAILIGVELVSVAALKYF